MNVNYYQNMKMQSVENLREKEPQNCALFANGIDRQINANHVFKRVHDSSIKKVSSDLKDMSKYLSKRLNDVKQTMVKYKNL